MRCARAASAMQVVGAVLMWLSSSLLTPVSPAPQQLAAQPRNMGREPRYKRVCYYTNWSQYRKNGGRFLPANIDPFICTHIVFAFAKLDHKGQLAPYEWNDVQYPYLYRQFTSLKKRNPELKALLAVGGWTLGSGPFSRMAGSKEGRRNFVEHALQYLRTHHFDGLDLDWEYPANRGSPPEDKENFSLLIKDLREAFEEEASRTGKACLILAAAVSVGEKIVVTAYDVPKLNKYLDFINLMSYDLHGSWSKFLGHNAPLYGGNYNTGEPTLTHSVDDAVRLWLRLGASRDKLVMGIPFYGRSFTTCKQKVKPGQRNCGVGKPAPFTKEKGFVSYYEMQSYLKNGWKRVWLEKEKVPYAYDLKTNQWVGYDDIESVQYKAEYIREQGLGGAMFWALDLDDFGGLHSDTAYPLARTVRSLLAGDEEFPDFNVPGKQLKKPGLRIRGNRKSPKPTPPSKKPPAYLKRPIKNPKDNVKNLLKNHIKTQKNPKDYVKNLKDHGNQMDTKFLPAGQDKMGKPEHDSPLSGLPKSLSGMNRATKSPGTSTPSSTSKVTARRNPAPWAPVRPEIVGSVKSPFTKPIGQGRRTTARTTPMPWSKNARKMVKQNTAEKSKAAGYTVKTTVKPVSVVKSKKNSYTVFNPFLKFKPQFLTTRLPQTAAATTTTTVATSTTTSTPSSTRTSTAKTSTTKRAATTTRLSPVSKSTSTQAPARTKTTASTTSPSTSTSSTTKSSTVPSTTTAVPSTSTSAVTSTRKQTTKNKSVLSDVTTTATPSPSSTVPPGSRWWGKNAEKAIQGPKTKADEYEVKNEKSQSGYTVESSETKKINKNQPVYTVKSSHKEGSHDVQVKTKESSSIYRIKSSDQQKISKTESEGRIKESPFKKPVAQKEGKVTRPKLTPPPSTRATSTSSYTTTPSYVPTTSTSSSSARTSSTTSGLTRITSKRATDSTTTSTASITTTASSTTVSSTTRAMSATTTKASSSHKTKSGRSKWLFETTKPTTTARAPADITAKQSAGTTSSVRSQPPNRKPYPKSPFTKPAKVHTKSASDAFGKKKDNPESLLKDLKDQVRVTKPVTSTTTEASTETTTTTPKPTTSTDTATTTHPRLSTSTTQTAKMTTTSGVKPTPETKILSFNLKSRDSLHKSENLIRGQNAEHKENKDSMRTQSNALRHDESRAGKGHSESTPKETGSAPKKSILSQTLKLPDYSQDPRRRQPTKSIFSGMVGKSSPSSSTSTRTRTTTAGTTAASTAPPATTSRVTTTTRSSSAKISTRPTPKARQWQRVTVASVKQNLSDKTFTKMSSEPKGVTPKTSITTSRNPTSTTTQSQHDTTSHTKPTSRRATVSVTPGFKSTVRIPQATKYQKNRGDLTVQAYKNLLKSSTVGGTRKASTTQATTTVTSLSKKTPTSKMTHRQSSLATKATSKVTDTVSTSTLKVPNTEKSAVPDSKKKGDKSQTSSLKTTIPSTSTKKVTLPPARAEATRPSTPSRTSTHARTTSTSIPSKEAVTGRRTARPVRPPPLARRPSDNEVDPFRWLGVSRFTTQPPTPPRRQEEDPNIRIRVKNPFRAPSKHLQGVAPEYGGVAQRVQADHGSLKTDGMPGLGSELRWWEKAAEPKDRQWWGMGQAARASMGSFSRKTFPDWRQHEVVTRPSASSRAPGGKSSKDCDKDSDAEQFKATGVQPESMRAGVEASYEVREPSTSPPRFETLPEEKMPLQSEYQPEYQPHFSYSPSQFEFECPTVFGIYSDPQDCHRFYQCVWLVAFHHVCGPGTVWNDEMKICDWPSASSCRS